MTRIAVAGFQHETNTFAPRPAGYADFEAPDAWPGLTRGPAVPAAVAGINLPLAGAIAALVEAGHEVVPLIWASAGPSGPVTRDAYERIAGMLLDELAAAGPVDGLCLDLHGAMVAEHLEDGEGALLARLREAVGSERPLVASLDLHANVSERMVELADGLAAYRSYPHVDMAETGARAARFLDGLLRGANGRGKAFRRLDFLIPLPWQCTLAEPAASLYRRLAALEAEHATLLSFAPGFPLADVERSGPTVFGYGREQDRVEAAVAELAEEVGAREADFAGRLWPPGEAVAHAIARAPTAKGPVVLADTQDNPGGGASSDTTGLLRELVGQDAQRAVLGLVHDPEAAEAAARAGAGARIELALGGRSGVAGDAPFEATFRVERLGDGAFTATGPFYRGSRMQLGPMALLSLGGVRVAVASRRQQAADQAMFRHLGVEPAAAAILALKSSVHFRADFGPLAAEVLVVAAPGANPADPADLPYRNLRPGLRLGPRGRPFAPA